MLLLRHTVSVSVAPFRSVCYPLFSLQTLWNTALYFVGVVGRLLPPVSMGSALILTGTNLSVEIKRKRKVEHFVNIVTRKA